MPKGGPLLIFGTKNFFSRIIIRTLNQIDFCMLITMGTFNLTCDVAISSYSRNNIKSFTKMGKLRSTCRTYIFKILHATSNSFTYAIGNLKLEEFRKFQLDWLMGACDICNQSMPTSHTLYVRGKPRSASRHDTFKSVHAIFIFRHKSCRAPIAWAL